MNKDKTRLEAVQGVVHVSSTPMEIIKAVVEECGSLDCMFSKVNGGHWECPYCQTKVVEMDTAMSWLGCDD